MYIYLHAHAHIYIHTLNAFYEALPLMLFVKCKLSISSCVRLIGARQYALITFVVIQQFQKRGWSIAMSIFCEPRGVLALGMWKDVLNYVLQ